MRSSPTGDGSRGEDVTEKSSGTRLRRAFYLVLLAVVIGLSVSYWSWVDAQARAVVVISSVLEAPILTPAAEAVSGEPAFEDVPVAGNTTLVVKPAGEGPWRREGSCPRCGTWPRASRGPGTSWSCPTCLA